MTKPLSKSVSRASQTQEVALDASRPPAAHAGTPFIKRLRRSRVRTKIYLFLVLAFVLLATVGPLLAPYGVNDQDLANRLTPPWGFGGDWTHPFGTDYLGRDVFSRTLHGARSSLIVATSVVVLSCLIGTTLGVIAGYRRGILEALIMRWTEVQMALPGLVVALVILAFLGSTKWGVVFVLSIIYWMIYAQVARSLVLSLSGSGFVEAAIIAGSTGRYIMLRHLVPNLVMPLSVLATLEFARALIAEATLSFLGFGIQPPETSWGLDIAVGREYLLSAWWLVTIPGAVLTLTVLSVNGLGSWLRDLQGGALPLEESKQQV
jgi:ABC-type dipeptide/oligopeptide/nickel transport system permease subunit